MAHLAQRIHRMEESATIGMARRSRELASTGADVISLSLGEPDFDTPEFIKNAAIEAIRNDYSHYTPIAGYPDLREAIARKLLRDNGLRYSADEIVVSTGAKQSILNVVMAVVDPGEEVLLPAPYWVSYKEMVNLAEGEIRLIPTTVEQDYKFTAAQLEEAIGPKTRLLLFSNPCNPSGAVYDQNELADITEVLKKHPGVYVISDEIYELIRFEGTHISMASFHDIRDQVITVNGLSKGFAMTGWRLGYLAAHRDVAKACDKLQGQVTSAPNSITQRAAITALEAEPSKVGYMKEAFRKRRELVLKACDEIPGFRNHRPGGAFYLFPDVSFWLDRELKGKQINTSTDLCMFLLEEAHVGLVPGDAFGNPKSLRISYAASEEQLEEAMKRIKRVLSP